MARSARASSARTFPGDAAGAVLTRTFEVEAGGHCRLNVPHADVELIAGPDQQAEVFIAAAEGADPEAAAALADALRLRAHYAEGTLRVEPAVSAPQGTDWWRRVREGVPQLHVYVRLPAGFGATVHAPGGTVEASGLHGAVTLDVTSGSARATGLRGRLDLYAYHSDTTIEDFDGKKLSAHVHGGALAVREARAETATVESAAADLRMEALDAEVHLLVQSGAAELRSLRGPFHAEVRGGTLSLAPDADLTETTTIHAPGGAVTLLLPDALAADLHLSAKRLFLKEALPMFEGKRSVNDIAGQLRSGGALIDVRAPGGEIRCAS